MSIIAAAPRWRESVASKLRNAFIGVSLFSLLAALVAIASFRVIEVAQDEVLDRTLPAALAAERMAKEGLSVVAATPALLAAADQDTLAFEAARIEAAGERLKRIISELRGFGVGARLLGETESELSGIFANLADQVDLVERRILLRARIQESAVRTLATADSLIELLKPAIVDASVQVLADIDEIRDELERGGEIEQTTLEIFETLADVDLYAVEQLTAMRFRADNVKSHIDELLLSNDPDAVESVRNDVSIDLRDMVRSTLEIEPRALQREIATALQSLSGAAHGDDSLFSAKLEFLRIESRLATLSRDNLLLAAGVQQSVELLLAEAQGLIKASSNQAREIVAWGRIVLIAIAATAFLAALVIIWKYVLGDVASRIRRLASVTHDLAQGNLDVNVDVAGGDELGEMADAVRVFKTNATDLRRSNAELEQFAYVASHDLKAPLRGVSNLATWIEQDIEDAMGSETKKHMSLLHGRIGRMEKLLEDLLQYSRVGRQQIDVRTVNLDHVVPETFKMVAPSEGFTLEILAALPRFTTAQAPLEQVFRNLISNAIKHHDGETGAVKIGFEIRAEVYEFSVEDDGPGIAPQYQKKIFNMFQTLKSRDEVEGSGMGLAMVKKIVDTVGCSVTVESDPDSGRGATFRFTWPRQWDVSQDVPRAA